MPLRVGTWLDILTAQDAAGTRGGPRCQSTASWHHDRLGLWARPDRL